MENLSMKIRQLYVIMVHDSNVAYRELSGPACVKQSVQQADRHLHWPSTAKRDSLALPHQ